MPPPRSGSTDAASPPPPPPLYSAWPSPSPTTTTTLPPPRTRTAAAAAASVTTRAWTWSPETPGWPSGSGSGSMNMSPSPCPRPTASPSANASSSLSPSPSRQKARRRESAGSGNVPEGEEILPRTVASDRDWTRLRDRWQAWSELQTRLADQLAAAAEDLAATLAGLEALDADARGHRAEVADLVNRQRRGLASAVAVQQSLAAIAPAGAAAAGAWTTTDDAASYRSPRLLGEPEARRGFADAETPVKPRPSVVLATALPVEKPDLVRVARLASAVAHDVEVALTVVPQREREYTGLCRLVLDHLGELADGPPQPAPGPARVGFGAVPEAARSGRLGGNDPTRELAGDSAVLRRLKRVFAGQAARMTAERPSLVERDIVSRRSREVWPHGLGRPPASQSL